MSMATLLAMGGLQPNADALVFNLFHFQVLSTHILNQTWLPFEQTQSFLKGVVTSLHTKIVQILPKTVLGSYRALRSIYVVRSSLVASKLAQLRSQRCVERLWAQ